jgi:hypothetical protein
VFRGLVASIAIAATATTGCSFAFVRGPGDVGDPPRTYPECTDSLAWPVVDGVMGLFSLAFAASPQEERYDSSTDTYEQSSKTEQVTSGLLMAAAFIGGAIYGYTRVSSCKEARSAFEASVPPQQPYYPPQQPYYPQQPQPYYPQPYPQPYPYPQPQPPPQQPQPGFEGGACLANNVCGQGLVCASNLCVRPAGPGGP